MAQNRKRRWRAAAGHVVTVVFLAVVAWLIAGRARTIDWDTVGESLGAYGAPTLIVAVLLVALSYALYAGYELLARAYVRHRLPRREVAAIAFVSYAFNLNLGAWIGGVGFRYRLYARHGLRPGQTTRILGMSIATNWLGYLLLGGIVFTLGALPLPDGWKFGTTALQGIGMLLLGAAGTYLGLTALSRRRSWRVRGHEIHLPPLRMALTQLVLSAANWLTIALILYVLLRGGGVAYSVVLTVLLVAAIAGVATHIPGGLGVIEAVFFAFLADVVPEGRLLAALLAYRAVYYLLPLLLAVIVYLGLEARTRNHKAHAHHAA